LEVQFIGIVEGIRNSCRFDIVHVKVLLLKVEENDLH
jgi:hypothetical protein